MLTRIQLQSSVLRSCQPSSPGAKSYVPVSESDSLAKLQLFPDQQSSESEANPGSGLKSAQSIDLDSVAMRTKRTVRMKRSAVSSITLSKCGKE